jgi:hypothetical protein
MPLSDSMHAHCPICGNLELKRIASNLVDSPMSFLWGWLRVPAYRCEPCRHKYFSLLPQGNGKGPLRELTPVRHRDDNGLSENEGEVQATASNR